MKGGRQTSGEPSAPAAGGHRTRTAARGAVPPILLAIAALAASFPTVKLYPPFIDEGALLTGAAMILRGGVFFRDIDAYPLPGAWYLLAGVMKVFGQSLVVARCLDAVVFAAAVVLAYLVARRIMGGYMAVLLGVAVLAVKYWAWPMWTMYFYSDVAIALALAGMLAFLSALRGGRKSAAFAAGLLFGAAVFCKQTVGFYPGLCGGALLAFGAVAAGRARGEAGPPPDGASTKPRQTFAWYLAGAIVAVGLPFGAFAAAGLGGRFIFNAVLQPFTGYLPLSGMPYTPMLKVWEFGRLSHLALFTYLPAMPWSALYSHLKHTGVWLRGAVLATEAAARLAYMLVPVSFLASGWFLVGALRRRPRPASAPERFAAWLLGGAIVLSVFPRVTYAHLLNLGPVWMVIVFLAGDLLARHASTDRWRRTINGGMAAGTLVLLAGGVAALAAIYSTSRGAMDLPRTGRLRVDTRDESIQVIVQYVCSHTEPGDRLFVYGDEAYYYFLCDRYSPWRFTQLYPGMTGTGGGAEVAQLLKRHRVRYVIQGNVAALPVPPVQTYAPALADYIAGHYRPVDLKLQSERRPDTLLQRVE